MPETTGTPGEEEHAHAGLMAGLEIVDADDLPENSPVGDLTLQSEPTVVNSATALPPNAIPPQEQALADIHKVWDNATPGQKQRPVAKAKTKPAVEKPPRRLLYTLPGLLLLALVAAFASWTTADPMWLSMGHYMDGTVTVKTCDYAGCVGDFLPAEGDRSVAAVRVTGDSEAKQAGETTAARVTSHDARVAYAGDGTGLWWRIGAGVALLIGCGFAVAAITGAWRWRGQARLRAVATSLIAPFALFVAVLALSW